MTANDSAPQGDLAGGHGYHVEPERRGGVFLKLLDARVFNAVTVNPDFGCVEWPAGVHLCPDAMHQAVITLGIWISQ